ncbi:MAG TPA: H-NS histone family protein [Burkholderiaceae bacterium]|nr:H-NS histone family protein [Burkholderiaceae bacterium]
MSRDTYSALQAKIEKEITKLQKQASALRIKRRVPVIASIVRTMREYDITPEEIAQALNKKAVKVASPKANGAASAAKRSVPIKYRHPETGETWTGRGKAPRWIIKAESDGKQRDAFLIEQ